MQQFNIGDKVIPISSVGSYSIPEIAAMIGVESTVLSLDENCIGVEDPAESGEVWWFMPKELKKAKPDKKVFTLIEFNEDTLVVNLPDGEVLGTMIFTYRDEDDWQKQIAPASEFEDEDDASNVSKLLSVLGYEHKALEPWRESLIGKAMRLRRDAEEYAKRPEGTPATWFEQALSVAPDILTLNRFHETGCLLDGVRGQAANNKHICRTALLYGWWPVEGDIDLDANEGTTAALAEEALDFLNEYAVAPDHALEWQDGDLLLVEALLDGGEPTC